MKIILTILLFFPLTVTPLEVVIDPYSDIEYDEINAYYIDEPEEHDYCACPWQ